MSRRKYEDGHIFDSGVQLVNRKYKKGSHYYCDFKCPYCGKIFETDLGSVVSGHTKSCGCLRLNYYEKMSTDLVGKKYGKLEVLEKTDQREHGHIVYRCKCDCGQECFVESSELTTGSTESCGCSPKYKYTDLTNQRFGRLTAIKDSGKRNDYRNILWLCKCDCGNTTYVSSNNLISGGTCSCGCLHKEILVQMGRNQLQDLTGQRFGKLVVIGNSGERNYRNQVLWNCKCDCGNVCKKAGADLRAGSVISCGCVNHNYYENVIADILTNHNIQYERQKTFKNCINPKTNRHLRFDFYLQQYNLCIEYDGSQHFKKHKIWDTRDPLENRQYRDAIKNQFCEDNNINLIRIPYTESKKIDDNYIMQLLAPYPLVEERATQ